jgi:hypothetical protein
MTNALRFLAALLSLLIAAPVLAQAPRAAVQAYYSQAELDQMLAPIALYPDPLLSQVLMAATYPAEVNEAAAWSRANPDLQGDDAVRAVQNENWDPSVKSLVAFPQLLARMAENPGWTQSLGDAFLAQEPHVMDTVQQLRRRAQAAGNLQSSEQLRVQQQGPAIVLQPASPQFVYVPYYDPLIVYGPWWWPAYRPIVWAPWPRPARIYLSLGFFFGDFDWHRHHARVAHPSVYYYRPAFVASRTVIVAPHRWQHEPPHRDAFARQRPVQIQQQVRIQPQPQVRIQAQPQPRVQAQPHVRHEQRARMPEAVAPQQPRAQQHEPRPEHRGEPRNERGHKGGERS